MALRWLIVALALFFIGALHTSHVAAVPQPGFSAAAMTLFSPAAESAHATEKSGAARPPSAAHHRDGDGQSSPIAGACMLFLTAAVGSILVVALGRAIGRGPASRAAAEPRGKPRRISISLTQLCVQRT
ncbi:hypothetical protein DMB66_52655 [Actinoplanes sp. ATCC 53533]|uniref:hypothetical protein n=1 Tax=Actinoplanes sp. ATCC 53533 TaxID=1288362 RepID=UPI000F77AC54|nr:hypothetical protein [Actinoplanes sp. ATCC 53533]RSM44110.1 hypothetical protein DMB66_52655 [Actinoplanes sp. ATCC 53533]